MIRKIFIAALALLLCIVSGCTAPTSYQDSVNYYYLRDPYIYGKSDGVIASERADANGHTDDIEYLLTNYLHGPVSNHLRSPFPADLQLRTVNWAGDVLCLTFSDSLSSLSGLPLTMACACIAMTSLELTGASSVQIAAESSLLDGMHFITMDADGLMLWDASANSAGAEQITDQKKGE